MRVGKSGMRVVAMLAMVVAMGMAVSAFAQVTGLYYKQVEKDGRIYVFNTPERYKSWAASGEVGTAITLIGRGPNGESVVAENETALDLFLFKNNLEGFDRPTPKPPSPPPPPPNVSLYGRAHVTVDHLDNGETSGLNLSSNSSRLGFRASTALSKTLKGSMQIEQEVRWENGAGSFASRDTFVGLEGGFGTIRLGFFDTPHKVLRGNTDFFGDQIGDSRNLTRLRDVYGSSYDFDTRFRNGIHYRTPKLGNVTADFHYSTNTDDRANPPAKDLDAFSGGVTYSTSALYLAGTYERQQNTKSNAFRLGFGYNVGSFRIAGLAQAATIKAAGKADQDVNTYGLGASYKLSASSTIKGQYYWLDADGADRNANMVAVGLDYSLHRSFRLLFAYAQTSNDKLVKYSMSAGGHGAQVYPAQAGLDVSGFSVGFRFDF